MAATGTPAAMEITSASGEIVCATSSSTRPMICGLTDNTTISADAGLWLSVVASMPYFSRNSSTRSRRGPDAEICAGAKSFPRRSPRNMASAMLPAPMKPMVRVMVWNAPGKVAQVPR
jgi:hypothetical protein